MGPSFENDRHMAETFFFCSQQGKRSREQKNACSLTMNKLKSKIAITLWPTYTTYTCTQLHAIKEITLCPNHIFPVEKYFPCRLAPAQPSNMTTVRQERQTECERRKKMYLKSCPQITFSLIEYYWIQTHVGTMDPGTLHLHMYLYTIYMHIHFIVYV